MSQSERLDAGPKRPDVGNRRPAHSSRLPAVIALLLVGVVIIASGICIAATTNGFSGTEVIAGVGAAAVSGFRSDGVTSEDYSTILSRPLPADAVKVRVPILMYHYVDDAPPPAGPYADSLTVRTWDFEEQLRYLVDNGYSTVSLGDVYLAMAGKQELPAKPLVLTFDDGGLDNYQVAFPLLKKYGFSGIFFIITGSVGREGQMGWDQLTEMAAHGMSIQSHSISHPDLRGVSTERLQAELVNSRSAITETLGKPCYVFCYPSGAYNEKVIEAVKAAGYSMALATDGGRSLEPASVFEIKRSRVQAFLPLSAFAALLE